MSHCRLLPGAFFHIVEYFVRSTELIEP